MPVDRIALAEELIDWHHVQTGFYYTVTGSTALLSGSRVADYIGGPAVLPSPGPNGWINPAAFAAAPQGRFGLAGTGDVEGPGMQIYNLSLSKFFKFGPDEKVSMRFRADFLNAFNCVNFQSPASTHWLTRRGIFSWV